MAWMDVLEVGRKDPGRYCVFCRLRGGRDAGPAEAVILGARGRIPVVQITNSTRQSSSHDTSSGNFISMSLLIDCS